MIKTNIHTDKPILDVCCGGRMFYFDKSDPRVLFCDIRSEKFIKRRGDRIEHCEIAPDVQCDFTALPFADNTFFQVIFDPPHLVHAGPNSWLLKSYGRLPSDWRDMIRQGFAECFRVLRPHGTLIFKWNETDIPVREILALAPHKPIFGHRSGKASKTHWLFFCKT